MATTTKKTTTAKPKTAAKTTTTNKTTKPDEIAEAKTQINSVPASKLDPVVETKKEEVRQPKKFAADDMIPCRSVRNGTLQYIGRKTGDIYEWTDYGDVTEVAYGDLLAVKANKSNFIYGPWFLIEDEDAVEALKLTELYNSFTDFLDIDEFLALSAAEIRRKLPNAPKGFKDTVARTAGLRIRDGSLDSVIKIKVIDEILGKNLMSMLNGGM